MIRTPIYTTKKLEKLVKKLIQTKPYGKSGMLGKWNATLFYIDRKKCWLITNATTQYMVILTDIKAADLKNIEEIFKNTLYTQLIYDGVLVEFDDLNALIGGLDFLPTDNDKKTTGFQNHRLQDLDWWKYEFGSLDNMPIKDLTNRMNSSPVHIGEGSKISDFTDSITEMKKLLTE